MAELTVICGKSQPINLEDDDKVIQSLSHEKSELIRIVVAITRIVSTNGSTSSTVERSFSMLRRLKTWLRPTVTQKRLNAFSLIQENQAIVHEMSLIDVANELVNLYSACLNIFGKFTDKDL